VTNIIIYIEQKCNWEEGGRNMPNLIPKQIKLAVKVNKKITESNFIPSFHQRIFLGFPAFYFPR
jgi:hypothetical protein